MYGMHGGLAIAKAVLYVLNDDEESMSALYSFKVSVMLFCQSSLLMGAEQSADRMAKYELKLFNFRRCFIIFKNLRTYFSLSL